MTGGLYHTLEMELPWPPAAVDPAYRVQVAGLVRKQEPRLCRPRGAMRGSLGVRIVAYPPSEHSEHVAPCWAILALLAEVGVFAAEHRLDFYSVERGEAAGEGAFVFVEVSRWGG